MASLYLSSVIDAAPDAVFTWHTRPGALERQLPPWSGMRVERQPPNGVQDGSRITLRMPVGPLRLPWVAVYYGVVAGRQ
ncbi:MAG TPA: TIGR01777 family protein, partial [bacterium]